MTNQRPTMSVSMKMGGPTGYLKQDMKLSPPIAHSPEEAIAFSNKQAYSSLDERAIDLVRIYLGQNPKSTNREAIVYLNGQGYSPTIRDISLARSILETE